VSSDRLAQILGALEVGIDTYIATGIKKFTESIENLTMLKVISESTNITVSRNGGMVILPSEAGANISLYSEAFIILYSDWEMNVMIQTSDGSVWYNIMPLVLTKRKVRVEAINGATYVRIIAINPDPLYDHKIHVKVVGRRA
jgi:hypothetical protein